MYTVRAYQWPGGKPGRYATFQGEPVNLGHHTIADCIREGFKDVCSRINGQKFPVRKDADTLAGSVSVAVAEIGPDGAVTMLTNGGKAKRSKANQAAAQDETRIIQRQCRKCKAEKLVEQDEKQSREKWVCLACLG